MFPDRPDPLMQTKMSQKWEEKTHFCQVFKPNIHSPGKGVLDKTPFRDQAFPANVRGPPSRGRTQSDPTREHKISLESRVPAQSSLLPGRVVVFAYI